jgi:hypothetical protein
MRLPRQGAFSSQQVRLVRALRARAGSWSVHFRAHCVAMRDEQGRQCVDDARVCATLCAAVGQPAADRRRRRRRPAAAALIDRSIDRSIGWLALS